MNDRELTAALQDFGIDSGSRDVLVLLPLVWVAWADGKLDASERAVILSVAESHVHLGVEGARTLGNWLAFQPDRERLERAAALLVALDHRVRANEREDLVDFCRRVAVASGSLFGRADTAEREAIEVVAHSLAVPPDQAYERLRVRLVVEAHGTAEEGWFEAEHTNPVGAGRTAAPDPRAPAAAGPPGLAWNDGEAEQLVELVTRIDVGRGRDNDLQLAHDGQLSRHHATLERREAGVYILDRESLNGVWVSGERVAERRLFGGELIVLGETAFRWRG